MEKIAVRGGNASHVVLLSLILDEGGVGYAKTTYAEGKYMGSEIEDRIEFEEMEKRFRKMIWEIRWRNGTTQKTDI